MGRRGLLMDAALIFDWAKAIAAVAAAVAALVALGRWVRGRAQKLMGPVKEALAALKLIPKLVSKMDEISHKLMLAEAENRALADSDPHIARFTCGEGGSNEYVNATYARWLEVSRSDLMGWRWLSYVPEADRDRLREEWETARVERRVYRVRHAMQTAYGRLIYVDTTVTPVPEDGPVHRWIGVMRRVEHSAE
jgi:PAS domain S-box-containing protein